MSNKKKTKNDIAWKNIFEADNLLKIIEARGLVEITSERINQERESRLMAKFDHRVNLPQIFREYSLSILPISRNKYAIGHFETYCNVKYNSQFQVELIDFIPEIETIDYTNLYSESAALNCAFNTGIIDRLFEEEMLYTVSGRMSTDRFSFKIKNIKDKSDYQIDVENSQCEIDTENYQFDIRQTQYYTDAARYLGLINKVSEKSNDEILFNLTNSGSSILKSGQKSKTIKFIQKILEHQVFYQVFAETLKSGEIPSIPEIQRIMAACNLGIKEKTIFRRSSTVRSWIQWILSQIE